MGEKIRLAKAKTARKEDHSSSGLTKPGSTGSYRSPVDNILHLQRTIGNRAVTRLIQSGAIQAELRIGQSDDMYEKETDRAAQQVMRMSEGSLVDGHRWLARNEKGLVQPKGNCGESSDISSCVESHINTLKGKGRPLFPATRDFFEPRFGSDFSQVRVHTGSDSAAIAREINAQAFTTGRDVFFGAGQYSPTTSWGKHLMAHELTHVIQQNGDMISSSAAHVKQSAPDFSIQRTTVVVEDGCAGTQEEIENAVADALTGIGRIADPEAQECLRNELNDAQIVCQGGETKCGEANYFGSTIYVYNWGDGCPSLPALIVHETAHKCKFWYTEMFAEACENEAFGGRGATPPEPDEAGGVCEL